MISITGYFIHNDLRKDRNDTTLGRGGGLIVYVRDDVIVDAINDNLGFNQYCKFKVMMRSKCRPLFVTLIYRSPNSNQNNSIELAKIIENCEKNCLIIGDFNLPSANFEDGSACIKGRPVVDAVLSQCLSNVVDFPTHVRGNMLDIALVDYETKSKLFNVEDIGNLGNSDHSLIKLEFETAPKVNRSSQLVRDWRKGDEEGLKMHLKNIDFIGAFQDKNASEAWDTFKELTEESLNRYIPLKPRRKQGDPPWMSHSVKRLINRKQRSWKKFKINRSEVNFASFKLAEKLCKKGVSAAKRKFERSIANNGNKRPFCAYVKSKTKARESVGPLKYFNLLHIYYRKELKEKKQAIQTKDYDCLDIKKV